jgi:hypothetical protein
VEKSFQVLGSEALPHVEIIRLKQERRKLEAGPPPNREKVDLSGWVKEKEAFYRKQILTVGDSIVGTAEREIQATWSLEGLKEAVWKQLEKQSALWVWPFIAIQYLPHIQKGMEETIFNHHMSEWSNRCGSIDAKIVSWQSKIQKPFSPELINKSPSFPVDRCVQEGGRWFDRWLSDGLKTKLIPFEPVEAHTEKLVKFYNEVYLPAFNREMAEKEKMAKVEVKPEASPQVNPYRIPFEEMVEMGLAGGPQEEPQPYQSRASRIYRGGKG